MTSEAFKPGGRSKIERSFLCGYRYRPAKGLQNRPPEGVLVFRVGRRTHAKLSRDFDPVVGTADTIHELWLGEACRVVSVARAGAKQVRSVCSRSRQGGRLSCAPCGD